MWHDFNHAWLGLLQKQKDITESEERLQAGQSLISKDELEDMGKELVRLCDGVEKHGLVDYEYGVWEEQIIASESSSRKEASTGVDQGVANSMVNSSHGLPRSVRIGRTT